MLINIELKGKDCLVVGAGAVACRKVAKLVAEDATVRVIAPEKLADFDVLIKNKMLEYIPEKYHESYLVNAYLVVVATSDEIVNKRVYEDCIKRNIIVNCADKWRDGSVSFVSTVDYEGIQIGITTMGKYPLVAKYLKAKIKGLVKEWIRPGIMDKMRVYRQKIVSSQDDNETKKEKLKKYLEKIMDSE